MTLIAFGINHKTAPVDIREKVAFAPEKMEQALHECVNNGEVSEAAIISTCNRTELYTSINENDAGKAEFDGLLDW
ncbi:MAG: glutamyl-tRNA reductase, partial [Gammaproteobacteria bacterium]|nr:glutamyl-tRNA reductase [Gammaproteobacteria bacterium]